MRLECYDLDWEYSRGSLYVKALAPDDGGGKQVRMIPAPFDPYCYIEKDALTMDPLRVTECSIGDGAPDGFLRIEGDHPSDVGDFSDRFAFQTYEADVRYEQRVAINEDVTILRPDAEDVLYFDIEVDDRGTGFTPPDEATDRVIAIAAIGGDGERYYFDNNNEECLLRSFFAAADDYVALAGWNSIGYDFPYLKNRLGMMDTTVDWDRWVEHDVMPLYDMLAKPTKSVSTKLGDTGEREFGEGKTEVEPGGGELWELWQKEPGWLREYNMQDADLVRRIDQKYELVPLLHTICDLCNYPPGQSCYLTKHDEAKFAIGMVVDGKVLETAREKGIPQRNRRSREKGSDFPGGYVLDPVPGMYDCLVVPDYSGMYPSIIRAWNFGEETYVPEDHVAMAENEDGVWRVTKGEYAGCRAIKGERGAFVHPKDGVRSVFAEAADELVSMREEAADIVDKGVKAVNNTIYGLVASDFHRYFGEHSANITLVGQELTGKVEQIAGQGHSDIEGVVYGDSVPGYEPVVWRKNDQVNVSRIDEVPPGADEVRGRTGWTELERVIEKPNRKQMYRVTTGAGVVHVTEDHSLILADGKEAAPMDVSAGDRLMHNEVHEPDNGADGLPDDSYEPVDTEAWLLGVFAGDGSAGVYAEGTQDQKSQWKVSKNDRELLHDVGDALERVHGLDYKIRDSYTDDSIFVTPVGSIKPLAESYREKCYNGTGDKVVPADVLNGDRETMLSFIAGYSRADGEDEERSNKLLTRFSSKSHVLAQGIRVLLDRLDVGMGVETKDNHGNEYLRAWPRAWTRSDPYEVESVEPVEYNGDHVYDLTTADESFGAGVGEIVVHNTDSVMIDMDVPASAGLSDAVAAAERITDDVEAEMKTWAESRGAFAEYLELDVDDVYDRFYIGDRKKRYFGHRVYAGGRRCNNYKIRGFEARQSSYPTPVREFQERLMRAKLHDEPTGPIVDDAKERLFSGEWDHELVQSRKLGQPIEEYDAAGYHVRAAAELKELHGEGAVQVGDKVNYIKYGDGRQDYVVLYDGELAETFRPGEGWCDECGEVVEYDGHPHDVAERPRLREEHYSYIWEDQFKSVMESVDVSMYAQTGLGAFG